MLRSELREVARRVQIGAQLLGGAEAAEAVDTADSGRPEPRDPVPAPKADGTLLAVIPIPGTGTSMAIVGYPVTAPGTLPSAAGADAAERSPQRSGLLLDHDQRRLWVDGVEVGLTFQEFELLAFLSAHPSTVFSRSDLVTRVWQRDFSADSRTVDVHVSRLRHKLGPAYGRYLVTEYRVGYQFRPAAG
jgi:Transcriptional regulatory protein, C terminal